MGAEIHMVSTAIVFNGSKGRSAILLSAKAGAQCLKDTEMPLHRINKLINTGLYRDKNIGEPAIATLIHTQIDKLLPDHLKINNPGFTGLFAFDMPNGGVGFLNGIQIANAFLENNESEYAMIVSGDAPPTRNDQWTFPYTSAASAIILKKSDKQSGFKHFLSRSYPEGHDLYSGMLKWKKPFSRRSYRNRIEISMSPYYSTEILKACNETLGIFSRKQA